MISKNFNFTNDNCAKIHPKILKTFIENNNSHENVYGSDLYTKKAKNIFKKIFESKDIEIEFLYNGTASNCLVIKSILEKNESVICTDCSYLTTVEYALFNKENKKINLIKINNINGKIDFLNLKKLFEINKNKLFPRIISITQPTEKGTLYSPFEIKKISDFCKENKLLLLMDGARISNAIVSLNLKINEFTINAGVDFLCFGATKNGLFSSEAVIFFNKTFHKNFKIEKKKHFQLIPKSKITSLQFIEFFKKNLWLKNANKANKMAKFLEKKFLELNFEVAKPVETNMVFVKMQKDKIKELQKKYELAVFNKNEPEVRFVTAWDTKKSHINDLVKLLKTLK